MSKAEKVETTITGPKAKTPVQRLVIWLLLNGGITACAIYGLFFHVEYAKNLLLFLAWSLSVLGTIAMMSKEAKASCREKGRSVPTWLAVTNDLAVMAMLASVGRYFTAAAVLWQILCEANIYEGND